MTYKRFIFEGRTYNIEDRIHYIKKRLNTVDSNYEEKPYEILKQKEIEWNDLKLLIDKSENFSFYCEKITGVPSEELIKDELSIKREAHIVCEYLFDENNNNLEIAKNIFFYIGKIKIYHTAMTPVYD